MGFHRRNVLYGVASLPVAGLLAGRRLPGLTATVYNGNELEIALRAAGPGSVVTLAPGDYGDVGVFTLDASDVSVSVRSAHRAVLRSPLVVNGSGVGIEGLAFERGVTLVGTGLRIAGTTFRGDDGVTITGVDTEVTDCDFVELTGRGVSCKGTAKNPHIHGNRFRDSRGGGNGHEMIQVGQSMNDSNRVIAALVENNLIERCEAESEAISIKSSGNTIRNNTLKDSRANIVNRHGENNTWSENVLDRAYCIVIHDRGNRLLNNRSVNPQQKRSIRIMTGSIPWDSTKQGFHPQACDTHLEGNTGALVVGDGDYKLPAIGTRIVSHSGPITYKKHSGTTTPGRA